MRPTKEQKRAQTSSQRGKARPTTTAGQPQSSPPPTPSRRSRSSRLSTSSASLTEEAITTDLLNTEFEGLQVSEYNPRSFPYSVKQQCWEKAEKVKGRDPDRWRRDPLGNIVFRKLVGCPGCLCHDYDHIVPYSKGGKSTLENCQVLQATVNRSKGNRTDISRADLIRKSSYCRVSASVSFPRINWSRKLKGHECAGRDMDLFELSAYGNVRRGEDSGGCRIQ